ncbi:RSP_7527 family protein [Jannaschia formosa]|nr:hypothetical protein [Jannaschia formosa]
MTPAQTDIVAIETRARALRAAYFRSSLSALVARLRPAAPERGAH